MVLVRVSNTNTFYHIEYSCNCRGDYKDGNLHSKLRCEDNTNCYFKQLARKTQECEKIKEKYEALKLENQEGYEIVAELKQECEELKDFARRQENQRETYYKEFLRVNSALEEIEGIVNVDFSLPCARTDCTYPEPCKDSLTENGTKCMRFALLKIKDIVRETEDV